MNTKKQEQYLHEVIEFGLCKNPIWPFAALIVDNNNKVLVKATDCAHISPLYHAESLAIHALVRHSSNENFGDLTLVTTAEPDVLAQSAIQWASVTHDLVVRRVVYGCSLSKIQQIWPFGIEISAKEVNEKSSGCKIEFLGPILELESYNLFLNAKVKQSTINSRHPGRVVLSDNVEDFFQVFASSA